MGSQLLATGSVLAAFFAGGVALFAPCCIVFLAPSYLAGAVKSARWRLLPLTFVFTAGLALVMVPLTLGASLLSGAIARYHQPLYYAGGVLFLVLAWLALSGRMWSLPSALRAPDTTRGDSASFFALGVFSGIASSCCAPVLAGVMTLSVLSGSVAGGLALGLAYVFGMVFPLFVMALVWDRARLGERRWLRPRTVRFAVGGHRVVTTTLNIGVAAAFAVMGGPRASSGSPSPTGDGGQGHRPHSPPTTAAAPTRYRRMHSRMGLQVLVVPARSDHPAPDPLFYLAGFGSSAMGDAEWAYRTFAPLEDRHDLVLVEQRGTGATAETCSLPPEGGDDLTAIGPAVTQCLASLQRDPRHDTTASAVRDLDAAREALGYETVDLYGISYGVTTGLSYLQAHPERVRTAVLDSGSLLDVRLWQRVPNSAQQAFDALVRDCAASPACAAAYDPAADLATLVHRLSAAPEVVDLGDGHTMTVDAAGLTGAVIDAYLATPETAVLLPRDLRAMVRGEWAEVLRARGLLPAAVNAEAGRVQVQTLTIRCSDEWAQMSPDAVAAQEGSLFTANTLARARWQQALCAVWPHDDGVAGTVQASAPVVFLNGEHDPADPPENVAPASRSMSASLAVTVPGGGHGVVDGCIADEVMAFIRAGTAPDPAAWAACTDTLRGVAPSFPAS